MKYLLTTSVNNDVIIAEVSPTHKKAERSEYFVSESFLKANRKNFTEITEEVEHDGRVWMLTSDMR
jgi:hypothetical protein